MRVIKHWSRLHRDCAISVLGDSKNLTGDSPGKPGLTLRLPLLWAGGGTRGPSPLKLFCDSVKINVWILSKMESWFWANLFCCFYCCAYNRSTTNSYRQSGGHRLYLLCKFSGPWAGIQTERKNYSATSLNLWQLLYNPFVGCLFFYRCRLVCLSQRS